MLRDCRCSDTGTGRKFDREEFCSGSSNAECAEGLCYLLQESASAHRSVERPSRIRKKIYLFYVVICSQTKHNLAVHISTLQSSIQIVVRRSEDSC